MEDLIIELLEKIDEVQKILFEIQNKIRTEEETEDEENS
jgi:hypothetical protein